MPRFHPRTRRIPRPSSRAALALVAAIAFAACDDPVGTVPGDSPLAGLELYVPYPSHASRQADEWRDTRPEDAAAMDRIASEPQGVWLTEADPVTQIQTTLDAAESDGSIPLFVAYFIPLRDCTTAGAADATAYRAWIDRVAGALRGTPIVVLEPDALPAASCVPDPDERLALLAYGTRTLAGSGAFVYVDAGHPRWLPVSVVAERLRDAAVDEGAGFALNVSNFVGTVENVDYGREIARELGPIGFVIDTSRNGAGPAPDEEWCNPPGRKLGASPTTNPPSAGVDALLWVKRPGESDGTCNGGPPAGEWWPEYALELAS